MYRIKEGDIITEKGARWEGSLGFRVEGRYAVSNKHVLPNWGRRVVHRKKEWVDEREIGSVASTVSWKEPTIFDWIMYFLFGRPLPANKVDASLIILDSDVYVEKAFDTPDKAVDVKKGMKVLKRGRTTGETLGEVLAESVTVNVRTNDGKILVFTDVYQFSNKTLPGDSGGVNRTDDGILGITFAGTTSGEYGFGIKATNIAKEFNLHSL